MVERQVIVTWYKPEEKLPPDGCTVVATISGKAGNVVYEKAMAMMDWASDGCGWLSSEGIEFEELTVHAWADLEPYGG